MFSYFSSSDKENTIDNAKPNEGVVTAETFVTEHSNISDDGSFSPPENSDDSKETAVTKDSSLANFTPAPPIFRSWNEAHDMYCKKHGTIKATIQQVLSETCKEENQEIPWELPKRNNPNVLVEVRDIADYVRSKRGKHVDGITSPRKPSISTMLMSPLKMMSPLKIVSAVASIVRDPDDEIEEWVQDGDDAFIDDNDANTAGPSSFSLNLNTSIFNPGMVEFAIQCLENEMDQLPPNTPYIMGLSEWNSWARSYLAESNVNNCLDLSNDDTDILLQVLVDLKRARIIRRENLDSMRTDVIVLSSGAMTTGDGDQIPENIRIAISLWDIKIAEEKIEKKLQEWSEQAAECTKNALKFKKRNQIKMATTQLAKRNLIQKRIDSDSRLQIQLLQTKDAIESAQSNRSILDLMADSTKLLRQLREETPLEEVDDVIDDLQSEIDDLQDITETISTIGKTVTDVGTDEELLAELQNLSLNDSVSNAPTAVISKEAKDNVVTIGTKELVATEEVEPDSPCAVSKVPELA